MKYKLIPLSIKPVHYQDQTDGNLWRGGAKGFFIVEPSSLDGKLKERDRELRCTIDLLLEVDGRTFYGENLYYRIAHTNLSNDRAGCLIGSEQGGTYSDFGSGTSPGGNSFLKMLYNEGADMTKLGTINDRKLGIFIGIMTYAAPVLWPLLAIREWRGIPRMDVIVSRRSWFGTFDHLCEDFRRLAREYLHSDYGQNGELELESMGHWLGMGHVLPIPSSFLEDNEYKQYDYRLVHEFVRLPPCPAVRR